MPSPIGPLSPSAFQHHRFRTFEWKLSNHSSGSDRIPNLEEVQSDSMKLLVNHTNESGGSPQVMIVGPFELTIFSKQCLQILTIMFTVDMFAFDVFFDVFYQY